jgi:hypothetical protein
VSLIVNFTVSQAAHLIHLGIDGDWRATAVAKFAFVWDETGEIQAVPARPIRLIDEWAGAPYSSGLLRAAELGPLKAKLDVLLAGAITFQRPTAETEVELSVGARLLKRARVFGDRLWLPAVLTPIVPSEPRPVLRVPIAWERSYGGTDQEEPALIEPKNPAGSGIAKDPTSLHGQAAPNFEHPETRLGAVLGSPEPVGFGPIAAHWPQRLAHAGTCDEAWEKTRRPLPPTDFSRTFFNVAPIDQQLDGYIDGEECRLLNMTPAGRDSFFLPSLKIPIAFITSAGIVDDWLTVDTVTIEPEDRRISILAKAEAPLADGPESLGRIIIGAMGSEIRVAVEEGRELPGGAGQ